MIESSANTPTDFVSPPDYANQDEADLKKARRKTRKESALQTPLETYLREINETNLLTAQEEKDLANLIAVGDRMRWRSCSCVAGLIAALE